MKFNSNAEGGRWWYSEDTRIMFIEFNGSSSSSKSRRHALYDRGEGHYDLIPHDDPIYNVDNIWSAGGIPHMNKSCHIVMQRVHYPVEYVDLEVADREWQAVVAAVAAAEAQSNVGKIVVVGSEG